MRIFNNEELTYRDLLDKKRAIIEENAKSQLENKRLKEIKEEEDN